MSAYPASPPPPANRNQPDLTHLTVVLVTLSALLVINPILAYQTLPPALLWSTRIAILLLAALLWHRNNRSTSLPNRKTKHALKAALANVKRAINQHFQALGYPAWRYVIRQPWYLIVSLPDGDRHHLLAGLDLHWIQHSQTNPTADLPKWWLSEEAVLIDLPWSSSQAANNLASSAITATQIPVCSLLWQQLRRVRGKQAIQALLVTVDVRQVLATPAAQQRVAAALRQPLQQARTKQPNLPVYLVLTHLDQIRGFRAFFKRLPPHDRQQPWGINLSAATDSQQRVAQIKSSWQALCQRINQQLIDRLHEEQDPTQRVEISQFHVTLARMGPRIAQMLTALHNGPQRGFHGIYLASHPEAQADISGTPLAPVPVNNAQSKLPRAFFIDGLMQMLLRQHPAPSSGPWLRLWNGLAPILSGLLLVGMLFWLAQYQQTQTLLQQLRLSLGAHSPANAQPSSLQTPHITLIQTLNHLAASKAQLPRHQNGQPYRPVLSPTQQLSAQAHAAYQRQLTGPFLQMLQQNVAAHLAQLVAQPPANRTLADWSMLYQTLASYLMLCQPDKLDRPTLQRWFVQHWQRGQTHPMPLSTLNLLHDQSRHLTALLNLPQWPKLAQDTTLVARAQAMLQTLPRTQLLSLILAQYGATATDAMPNSQGTGIMLTSRPPARYQQQHLHRLYEQVIPATVQALQQGHWVVGQLPDSGQTLAEQIAQARRQYLADYQAYWSTMLTNMRIPTAPDLAALHQRLQTLSHPNAQRQTLFAWFKANLASEPTLPDFNAIVSRPLEPTIAALAQFDHSKLQQVLGLLSTQLAGLPLQGNPTQLARATFLLSKQHMQASPAHPDPLTQLTTQLQQQPTLLQPMFQTLRDQVWQHYLAQTQTYIAALWQRLIYPMFAQHLAPYYPFTQQATLDLAPATLTQFFGPEGMLALFFREYLAPFVNTSGEHWAWQVRDEQHLAFSEQALAAFADAALLQHVLFANHHGGTTLRFTLTPAAIKQGTRTVKLEIDQHGLDYQANNPTTQTLSWALGQAKHPIRLTFISEDNTIAEQQFNGPWALFRWLDTALVTPLASGHQRLQFNHHVLGVQYELAPLHSLSPMTLRDRLQQFKLPQQLTS